MCRVTVPIRAERKKDDRPEPCLGEFSSHAPTLCGKSRLGG
jgi:hypothetical protein